MHLQASRAWASGHAELPRKLGIFDGMWRPAVHFVRLDFGSAACDGLIGVDRVLGESSWRMHLTKEGSHSAVSEPELFV